MKKTRRSAGGLRAEDVGDAGGAESRRRRACSRISARRRSICRSISRCRRSPRSGRRSTSPSISTSRARTISAGGVRYYENRRAGARRGADLLEVRPAQLAGRSIRAGQHLEGTVLALSRERVRRAAIGLGILRRYAPEAVASPMPGKTMIAWRRRACDLTISDVRTTVVGTPWRELVFVELETDDGPDRHERSPHGQPHGYARSRACTSWRRATSSARTRSTSSGWPGTSSAPSTAGRARSRSRRWRAFDVACWDLIGQSLGVPIWKLLGGRVSRPRAARTRTAGIRPIAIPLPSPAARSGVVDRGYRALKLDPFGARAAPSSRRPRNAARVEIVAAVREAVGSRRADHDRDARPLHAVDGRAVSPSLLEPFEPEWIEEPTPPENPAGVPAGSRRRRTCRLRPASARTRSKTSAASSSRPRRHRPGRPDALRRLPRR